VSEEHNILSPKDRRALASHLISEALSDITTYILDLRVDGDRWAQLNKWASVRAFLAEANRLCAFPESAIVSLW